ncbi:MAG: type I glyceraldehyde-3-phosphate dehydrogenase [Acidimicrobiales bacterium]
MPVRVGINGFGRIGRNFLRALLERQPGSAGGSAGGVDVEVVAANDLVSLEASAHLLKYDSTRGRLSRAVELRDGVLHVGPHRVMMLSEADPKSLGWGDLGVDVVIESTGRMRDRAAASSHLEAGARRVIVSAPAKDMDATFVVGVNDSDFDPERHHIVSNGSCTTNCLVPMVKVLDDAFGVAQGLMTTVHAYTNDQELLDLGRDDLRRARAAAVNIVPASTGAARTTSLVLSTMEGRLDGHALRVPVADGSVTDLTAVLDAAVGVEEVNTAFERASASGPLSGVLDYTNEPIVSSDILGSPASCTFDARLTLAIPLDGDTSLVKIMGWYDNEWGYSHRLVDLALLLGSQ